MNNKAIQQNDIKEGNASVITIHMIPRTLQRQESLCKHIPAEGGGGGRRRKGGRGGGSAVPPGR